MTLRSDFEPSVPNPTSEEMQYAHDSIVAIANHNAQTLPPGVPEIFERRNQVARELSQYLREDTSEIAQKMLPEGEPVTMDRIMDMLHVYYWWDVYADDPVNCLPELLADLDDSQFSQAVEVLHDEFRDLCAETNGLGEPLCASGSGMECLQQSIEDFGDDAAKTIASANDRSEALTYLLTGIDFSKWHFDQEFLEDDANDIDDDSFMEDSEISDVQKRTCHSFAEMLGRRAVERLVEAGLDDIEALEVSRVFSIEHELREMGDVYGERYAEFRNAGGSSDEFLAILVKERLRSSFFSTLYARDVPDVESLSDEEKRDIARRSVEEDQRSFELLEAYYQLDEHGISPFYRRQFSEDHFPPADRC